jgi:hypothetical protein
MANVQTKYSRLTALTVGPNAAETALLSAGAVGTDFKGSLSFVGGMGGFVAGDVVRLFASFVYFNNTMLPGSARFRLYLSPALANPIMDSNALTLGGIGNNNPVEFMIYAQLTIRTLTVGINLGTGYCDSYRGGDFPLPFFILGPVAFTIDTGMANNLELTATVGPRASIVPQQCSVEYLPSP